jgi:DNA modification methylase
MPITPVPATIPTTSLLILPDRQRKDFGEAELIELASSIHRHGLFHAIQVRQDGLTLVSGERRYQAITKHLYPLGKTFTYAGEAVPPGHIPIIPVSTDDPLALEEIELDENFRRKDLTWQEHAAATARLHSLRQAQAVAKADGPVIPSMAHTVADTSIEIHGEKSNNATHEEVRKEILISRHMDKPEVAKAPDLKSAFKALKKIEDADRNRALAIAVGSTHTAGVHKVFHAPCTDWMAQPEWREKFDVILTDPPYGMGAQDFGDGAGRLEGIDHDYDDSYEAWQKLMREWCPLSYAVAKPQAHAYVFCDIGNFHELGDMMRAAGWYVFRTPFTNYKQNSGRVPLPDKGPRRQSEWCLYAIKGGKTVNYIASDVIITGADEQMSHGAQKPVALYEDLLRRSVKAGDLVLDTFGGSGTLLPAAHGLLCQAVVVEKNPTYYGLCLQRLAGLDTTQAALL